jgi:hypothetical protein
MRKYNKLIGLWRVGCKELPDFICVWFNVDISNYKLKEWHFDYRRKKEFNVKKPKSFESLSPKLMQGNEAT